VSIRVRLLLLVLATALLPAILVGLRYYQDRGRDIDVAISSLAGTARTIAAGLDTRIQGTTQLHFGLARARDLVGHDKVVCSSFLAQVLEKNPQFTGILTIDPERARQAAEEPTAEGQTRVAGDMDGRNQGRCRAGVRRLHRELHAKIREGGRLPEQGS
jgi:hypothetical protein